MDGLSLFITAGQNRGLAQMREDNQVVQDERVIITVLPSGSVRFLEIV